MSSNQQSGKFHANQIVTTLHDHMQQFGYAAIDLPIIDNADMFLIKAGDQIINHLFTFERHGQLLALRPEFTAPAVHRYIATSQQQPLARWQFSGDVFIDDPVKPNGSYQHRAIGAEIIGMQESLAEAEIISMSALGLSALGIQNWEVTIGHAGLTRQILAHFDLDTKMQRILLQQLPALRNPKQGKKHILDEIDKNLFASLNKDQENDWIVSVNQARNVFLKQETTAGSRTFSDITRRLWEKQKRVTERPTIVRALDFLDEWCRIEGSINDTFTALSQLLSQNTLPLIKTIDRWKFTIDLLIAYDIPQRQIKIKPDLARNWEYYTGTVFDLHVGKIHVGGGGRYDELARLIGSKIDIPAVGFAYYADQLSAVIPAAEFQTRLFSICAANEGLLIEAIHLAQQLRGYGIAVQLSPRTSSHNENALILIEDMTSIQFENETYMFSNIENLIDRLKS